MVMRLQLLNQLNWIELNNIPRSFRKIRLKLKREMLYHWEKLWVDVDEASYTLFVAV